MNKKTSGYRRRTAVVVGAFTATVLLALNVPTMANHGLPHAAVLGSGAFLDEIGMTVRSKIDGRETQAVQMSGGSNLFVLQISIEAGGIAPWHNHNGIGFLVNLGPGYLNRSPNRNTTPMVPSSRCQPQFCINSLRVISPWVINGSSCSLSSKTRTTFGTT